MISNATGPCQSLRCSTKNTCTFKLASFPGLLVRSLLWSLVHAYIWISAPPPTSTSRPPDVIHVMNAPRPSPSFAGLLLPCIGRNWGGLGTRLLSNSVICCLASQCLFKDGCTLLSVWISHSENSPAHCMLRLSYPMAWASAVTHQRSRQQQAAGSLNCHAPDYVTAAKGVCLH